MYIKKLKVLILTMEFTQEQLDEIVEIAFPHLDNVNYIDPGIKYLSRSGKSRMGHLLAKARKYPETKWGAILKNIMDFAGDYRWDRWLEPEYIRAQKALEIAYTANQIVKAAKDYVPFK